MKYKKIMLLTLFIVSLLAVSAVGATDNATSDVISVEETAYDVVNVNENTQIMKSVNNESYHSNMNSEGTFSDLANIINKGSGYYNVTLEKDYKFDSNIDLELKEGITIESYKYDLIIIDGKGHTIDGNGKAKIFSIGGSAVILKNIIFTNIYSSSSKTNGAIFSGTWHRESIIDNCSFININVKYGDSALTWHGTGLSLNNCYFANNNANNGRLVIFYGKNINVTNCTFINNTCSKIIDFTSFADSSQLNNCNFINNNPSEGSVVDFGGDECIMTNCSFVNNTASKSSTVYWSGAEGLIFNCSYVNNSAYRGGDIYIKGDECILKDSIFYDNYALQGGAIYWSGSEGTLTNCIFDNNAASSTNEGGAIYWTGKLGNITDCLFINNSAYGGSAISLYGNNSIIDNCSFIDNYGFGAAGAIYSNSNDCIFNNLYFINNRASQFAGGLFLSKNNNMIKNCHFINNSAEYGGSAIINGENNKLLNCSFENNNATDFGGAIYQLCKKCIIDNSSFVGNSAKKGGAIFIQGTQTNITKCKFISNSVSEEGGAVYWYGNEGILNHCSFENNLASIYGGAIYWFGSAGNLVGSNFTNNDETNQVYWSNKDSGNIEDCIFTNNTHSVINNGATFKRNEISLIYYNSSFEYKSPINISINLINTLENLPIKSTITFIFNKENTTKNFVVKIVNNTAFLYNELYDLSSGTWFVTAICNGDDNYNSCETKFTVKINSAPSSLTFSADNTTLRHKTTINTTILDNNDSIINEGNITFYENNKIIAIINVVNGVANLVYTPFTAGEHTITAIYTSNNYLSSNTTCKLYVDTVILNVTTKEGIVGFNNVLIANVNGLYSIINNGTVIFYEDNNKIGNATVVDGVAKLNYTPLDAGKYTIKVVYSGSDKFDSVENSTSFIVDKADTNLIIDEINGSVGKEIIFTTHITSSNKLTINEGIVNFYDGEKNIGTANVVNGIANLVYTPSTAGKHIITAIYTSNNYLSSNYSYKFNVTKSNTNIIFDKVDNSYYNTLVTFIVNVLSNGINVNEGIVKFYINNVEIAHETLNNGVTFNYTPPNTGNFVISAVFEETDNFFASSASYSFVVNELPVLISSSDVTTVYNNGNYLSITLKDLFGNALTGVKINVNLNGVKTLTTDKNGQAKITTNGLTPKIYSVEITFDGNKKYLDATKNVKVTVKKANPKLTAQSKTFKKSVKTKKYAVTLKTNQNKVIKNTKITLKVNGKTYSAKTNTKGIATFKITKLNKKGKFTANIKYMGNNYYNAKSVVSKITVK